MSFEETTREDRVCYQILEVLKRKSLFADSLPTKNVDGNKGEQLYNLFLLEKAGLISSEMVERKGGLVRKFSQASTTSEGEGKGSA